MHHVDEDRSNNEPENLVAAHNGCHSTYHHSRPGKGYPKGRPVPVNVRAKMSASQRARHAAKGGHSEETRQKIGAANAKALRGRKLDPKHREAISAGLLASGRVYEPLSDERKALISATLRRRAGLICDACGREIRGGIGNLRAHQDSSRCVPTVEGPVSSC